MTSQRSSIAIGLAATAGLLLAAGPATAQVQGQKLMVEAFVGDLCTVTGASLDFGTSVDPSANTEAEGAIEINCATSTAVDVHLDGGLQFDAGAGTRAMSGPGTDLLYALYKDPTRSDLWSVNEALTVTIDGPGSIPVYGTIPGQSNGHLPGLHTDEVTITLSF